MKFLINLLAFFLCAVSLHAQEVDPELTEVWEPVPQIITPGNAGAPPSDAIVLFDGSSLDKWLDNDGGDAEWKVESNAFSVVKGTGDIYTKAQFGSMQLHIEWRTPSTVVGDGQGRGNSGIFLQGIYELQVLDSYNNVTYSNGQAASIYKQTMPLVNASKGPGEWQIYDVIYHAPTFTSGREFQNPPYITVFHNGVLVQDHTEIQGNTPFRGAPLVRQHGKGPLRLQDHGNPTSFRNIWVREL